MPHPLALDATDESVQPMERERRTVAALLELSTAARDRGEDEHLDLLLGHARRTLAPYGPVQHLAATVLPGAKPRVTTETAHTLCALEERNGRGPLAEALAGRTADDALLADGPGQRWPALAAHARGLGLHRLVALPMCAQTEPGGTPLGALLVFRPQHDPLPERPRYLLHALTVATAVQIRQRMTRERIAELQHALDSRVLIEQAKGMLAERSGQTPDEAFAALRRYARANRRKLHDLARAILDGSERGPTP
ncbi:ANTAR domain-containing response regulator [Streptomyces sp. NPDC048172]|uniref:ANTAR domain-containing response regulator n=1 Tax=Streptomyces sp. NPDC048172 TaxID=3365505 RepID=UPI00372418FE